MRARRPEPAAAHADEGHELTEQAGQATLGAYLLALRALADALAGDVEAARERAERALAMAEERAAGPRITSRWPRSAARALARRPLRPRAYSARWWRSCAASISGARRGAFPPDHLEALIALGELQQAAELLDWYSDNASASVGAPRWHPPPAAAHCCAASAGAVDESTGHAGRPRRRAV